ncbi:hypothetical protein FZ103_18965 [Streptomonospora sp. PA3]|uniref:hypothetical protein n=1 Tax=Streptomonospora sp. PA3 TaxID=2607326 RepID=UPI0012DC40B8|nr:hypothetical protein [Streptomonospora sp. PA3]MUL43221.1 hypothetical protein [Streptomonospora sp. PA3]
MVLLGALGGLGVLTLCGLAIGVALVDPPTGTAEGSTDAEVPAEWAGTWSGEVEQGSSTFNVTITLKEGSAEGSLEIPSSGCTGELGLNSVEEKRLEFRLEFPSGSGCVNGTVVLEKSGEELRYSWSGESSVMGGIDSSGTLSPQSG